MNVEITQEAAPGAELGILKALADESRLAILGLVAGRERSVSELAALLAVKPSTVSHHLAKLRDARLVGMRSAGTTHYYRLDTAGPSRRCGRASGHPSASPRSRRMQQVSAPTRPRRRCSRTSWTASG